MSVPDRARLLKTAHDHIEEFNKWTPESVLAYRTPDSTHEYRPASLKSGRLNHESLTAVLNHMRSKVPEFKFTIIHEETMVDIEQRKVLLYLKCRAPTAIGIYKNEYFWVLKMTEDGTEIEESLEFMDSDYANTFMAKLGLNERPDPLQE
ncbi:hypothetical protein FDECE_15260 [Fusarium decemcellulare]|nr:hypothetical protein FDECE_15260 [Fusarium decemcellulare]